LIIVLIWGVDNESIERECEKGLIGQGIYGEMMNFMSFEECGGRYFSFGI
jgi:hypothetical protein